MWSSLVLHLADFWFSSAEVCKCIVWTQSPNSLDALLYSSDRLLPPARWTCMVTWSHCYRKLFTAPFFALLFCVLVSVLTMLHSLSPLCEFPHTRSVNYIAPVLLNNNKHMVDDVCCLFGAYDLLVSSVISVPQ